MTEQLTKIILNEEEGETLTIQPPIFDSEIKRIGIIGGAGHVGFPFGLTLAAKGFEVISYDIDDLLIEKLRECRSPYNEEGAQAVLEEVYSLGRILYTTDIHELEECDVLFITVGTPFGKDDTPNYSPILKLSKTISMLNGEFKYIAIRSTLSPNTTSIFKKQFYRRITGKKGKKPQIILTPERMVQGRGLIEAKHIPQVVGIENPNQSDIAEKVREDLKPIFGDILLMDYASAEIGKLMTNAWRYATFALANEFSKIAMHHGVNFEIIRLLYSLNYPRFNIPSAGPNVGGPCLKKDTKHLIWESPYNDMLNNAIKVNESMPHLVADYTLDLALRLRNNGELKLKNNSILILGGEFKRNQNDSRDTLIPTLTKRLSLKGFDIQVLTPYHETKYIPHAKVIYDPKEITNGTKILILMTPHDEFKDLGTYLISFPRPFFVVDFWSFYSPMNLLRFD